MKPDRNSRERDQQKGHKDDQKAEQDRTLDHIAQCAGTYARDDEKVHAHRGRELRQFHEQYHDNTEQNRVDIVDAEHRKQQGHHDDNDAETLDQSTQHGQQQEYVKEVLLPGQLQTCHIFGDRITNAEKLTAAKINSRMLPQKMIVRRAAPAVFRK